MRTCASLPVVASFLFFLCAAGPCLANFHLMQIEQVMGGVEGDLTAQAIQLRMRAAGQPLVAQGRIRAWDSAGANPVMIIDFTTNVPNSPSGARILICTAAFLSKTSPTTVADYIMTNPIPASYLAAGKLTFESDGGSILWSIAWGGGSYTGTNTGVAVNDVDGNFGSPFPGPLPSTGVQSLLFPGLATAPSTNNLADYTLSAGAAVFTNNVPTSFTVQSSCTAPSISTSPEPGHDRVGNDLNFTVTASGTATLSSTTPGFSELIPRP